jgi:NAD(P)-dependent dehydrogenase (short-subunit alcohol dehydrogenase family)
MKGRVCVITGASAGIGLAAAEKLGAMGARLVLVGRDKVRGEAALSLLRSRIAGLAARFHYADLSRLGDMHRLGREIAGAEPRIDVLVNNAGMMIMDRRETPDGFEIMFAVNHLAYFVVTHHLLPSLREAGEARIVNVASIAHRRERLDFDDLQTARHFTGMRAYGRSKLANILFTRELARRLAGTGITANCLHPGLINSHIGEDNRPLMRWLFRLVKRVAGKTPAQGAETIVHLAESGAVAGVTGRYFVDCRETQPSPEAQEDEAATRLWQESERMAGFTPNSPALP